MQNKYSNQVLTKNRFLRNLSIIGIASVFFLTTLDATSQILDKSVAVVTYIKTESITKNKIDKQYNLLAKQTASLDGDFSASLTKKDVLEATIDDILISQAANAQGLNVGSQQIDEIIKLQKEAYGTPISDEDFKTLMEKQTGLSWAEYRTQIRKRLIQEQYITVKYENELREVRTPSNADITKTYEEYATLFLNPAMVRIEHLFWDARDVSSQDRRKMKDEAERSAKTIKKSSDKFDSELKKSLENVKIEGGDLGYIIRDDQTKRILGVSFLDLIFSLKEGEVSSAIESNSGYHIVKVTDKRSAKLLSLDDPILPGERVTVRERIISTLQDQYRQQKFTELIKVEVEELRKKAKIRILDPKFK